MTNTPKGQVEKQLCLDIRALQRRDALITGRSTTLAFFRNDRLVCQLFVTSNAGSISWSYRSAADNGRKKDPCSNEVEVINTPCYFGGTRPWFSCPSCHKRAAILYFVSSKLVCRTCGHFNYASQQMTDLDYKLKQVAAHRSKLKAGDMFFHKLSRIEKPKHMRYTTYLQILGELHLLERDALKEMINSLV